MARKRYGLTEARIRRYIGEGRGKGTGKDYKPWFYVSDVPSRGRLHRFYCPLTDREHHLLSDNEYYAFLLQWWDDNVLDIREQFPFLDRRETLEVAARCGVRHPVDSHSGALWVITTDLLITKRTPSGPQLIAYAVKDAEALSDTRTLELLEIERRLWERREVPWYLLTDHQVKNRFSLNLSWLYNPDALSPDFDQQIILHEFILEQNLNPRMPIRLVCANIDRKLRYKSATTLGVLRHLLSVKAISTDLNARSLQNLPAQKFSITGGEYART